MNGREATPAERAEIIADANRAIAEINRHETDRSLPLINQYDGISVGCVLGKTRRVWVHRPNDWAIVDVARPWTLWRPGLFDFRRNPIPPESVRRVRVFAGAH